MNLPSSFTSPMPMPEYPDVTLYEVMGSGRAVALEPDGWKSESMSWKDGCYIHAGLSGPVTTIEGPDAAELLSALIINGFAKFPSGSSKHAVMLNDSGLIIAHGLLQRDTEQKFRWFAGGPLGEHRLGRTFDVQITHHPIYIFQVAGPTAIQALERATGESLRDIKFLRFRDTQIDGVQTEICRMGMAGTLAYELRGPLEQGPQVYDAVVRAGRDLGLRRLGWRTYPVNHAEAGFPQIGWTFRVATGEDVEFESGLRDLSWTDPAPSGSVDPDDRRALYRTPVEVGWERLARFDHDFIGREALEAEMADPKRTIVTLRWNPEDVVDIYASLLRPGEEYKTLDTPTTMSNDYVVKDGKRIGISSHTTYSYYFREVISLCTIDLDFSEIGTEVVVQWGDFGKRMKDVRATVERYPYLDETRNQTFDLSSIPSGVVTPT